MARKCSGIFFLFILYFLAAPVTVANAVSISPVSVSKTDVMLDESFQMTASMSGVLNGESYFIKCRIGSNTSSLSDGQTHNSQSNNWLNDTSAWVDMPQVSITGDGAWQGNIECRVKSNTDPGSKVVFARACLNESGTCNDSFQSSTSLALNTVRPTQTPSPSPTNSPAPTNTPQPTGSPTPRPTATRTPTPKLSKTPTPTEDLEETLSVNDTETPFPISTPSARGANTNLPLIITLAFTGAGLGMLSLYFVWRKRNALLVKKEQGDDILSQ